VCLYYGLYTKFKGLTLANSRFTVKNQMLVFRLPEAKPTCTYLDLETSRKYRLCLPAGPLLRFLSDICYVMSTEELMEDDW
jgi:hypothetical protein